MHIAHEHREWYRHDLAKLRNNKAHYLYATPYSHWTLLHTFQMHFRSWLCLQLAEDIYNDCFFLFLCFVWWKQRLKIKLRKKKLNNNNDNKKCWNLASIASDCHIRIFICISREKRNTHIKRAIDGKKISVIKLKLLLNVLFHKP